MSFFKQPVRKVEKFNVKGIQFLGEQDGPYERLLKEQLRVFFRSENTITKAYLAKIGFPHGKDASVALGLRTLCGADQRTVETVGEIFASIFNVKEHLEIIFLSDDQEPQVASVCKPFFEQAGPETSV